MAAGPNKNMAYDCSKHKRQELPTGGAEQYERGRIRLSKSPFPHQGRSKKLRCECITRPKIAAFKHLLHCRTAANCFKCGVPQDRTMPSVRIMHIYNRKKSHLGTGRIRACLVDQTEVVSVVLHISLRLSDILRF